MCPNLCAPLRLCGNGLTLFSPNTQIILIIATFIMALGLLKINLCGPGLTETTRALWRKKPQA